MNKGALSGIRVIDMTRVIAGPMGAQTLGDLGAEVLKIERPGEGDDMRRVGPPWMPGHEGELSTYFQAVNRNKQSVTINFADPEGAELLKKLVAKADVLFENYRPGTLARYGIGWEDLRKINPRLIYCSVSGFGQEGPYASRSGYDYLAQAMAGAMNVTGHPEGSPGGGPMRVGIPMADLFAGLQATIGILAALRHRDITGRGQMVDVSLFAAQFSAMLNPASSWLNSGAEIGHTGNDHPSAAPYGVYPVDDGYILIATFSDREFVRLAEVLGYPEWSDDPRFNLNAARVANRAALKEAVAEALKGRTRDEWVEKMNVAKVSCGPINKIQDLEDDLHVIASGMIASMQHPVLGEVRTPASAITLSETPVTYRKPPPMIGEDTDAVLSGILGLDSAEIADLHERNIV